MATTLIYQGRPKCWTPRWRDFPRAATGCEKHLSHVPSREQLAPSLPGARVAVPMEIFVTHRLFWCWAVPCPRCYGAGVGRVSGDLRQKESSRFVPRWQGRTGASSARAPGGQCPAVLPAGGSPLHGSVSGSAVSERCWLISALCLMWIYGLCVRGGSPAPSSAHTEHWGRCGQCLSGYALCDLSNRDHASGV